MLGVIELIEQGIADGLHLGAQVCVSQHGETIADIAIGKVSAEPDSPDLTPDSIALWMSSGKPITATAIGQLYDRGELDFDDPVAQYLPTFAAHGKHEITIAQLLMHTAGIRTARFKYPQDDWDTIVAAICDTTPQWPAGEQAGYHIQTSWFILGELVRVIDGRPIDAYVRDEIFEPLLMLDSWMGMPPGIYDGYVQAGRLMTMPNTAAGETRNSPLTSRDWSIRPRPGGNCMGPIRELARFYQMLLAGGELDAARILKPSTAALLTSRRRAGMFDQTFKATVDWSLGFVMNSAEHAPRKDDGGADLMAIPYGYGPHASRRTYGHSGAQSSVGFADPVNELAVGVVFNGMPGEGRHQTRITPMLEAIYRDIHAK